MMQIEIAGRTYNKIDCSRCESTGKRHDPTTADKINVGPYAGRCATCNGKGYTLNFVPPAEIRQAQERETERVRAAFDSDPDADLPDWML